MSNENPRFTRPTIVAAVELLVNLTQAQFNQFVLRLELENEIPSDTVMSVAKKCALVGREVVSRSTKVIQTVEGEMTLGEVIVREAVKFTNQSSQGPKETVFLRGLERDGYVVSWDLGPGQNPILRSTLPKEIDLPATDDEVHQLLKVFSFHTSLGHLDQAIAAHTRGDWAAANSQVRTFLESLFNEIAQRLDKQGCSLTNTSENNRALLAERGFLLIPNNEWTNDGKNYINGLFKMLHTEGNHPGLSDEDHCTFRLHIVLVTARTFLRRFYI